MALVSAWLEARQVVKEHGGSIHVASLEGHGSIFTVRLPRDAPAPLKVPVGLSRGGRSVRPTNDAPTPR